MLQILWLKAKAADVRNHLGTSALMMVKQRGEEEHF